MTVTDITKHKLFAPGLSAVLALYYTLPFLLKITWWGGRDWDLFTTMAAVPVGSLLDYGQFPFWNLYLGGGNILFHHPEVAILSPFFLLYLVFGAVVGLKLQVLICYFIGFYGSIKLSEQLGMSTLAAAMTSVAYFGSVHFALHFAEGHMPFTHFCFLPWFLYFLLRSPSGLKHLLAASICLVLMILGNGAAIPLLYTLTFSTLLVVLLSVTQKSYLLLKNLALMVVAALGLSAIKIIPMAIYLLENRWAGNPDESIPLSALGSIFFGLTHSLYARNFPEQFWAWHEYGAYLSPLLIALALSALVPKWRRYWHWMVLLVFFLILGLGDFGWFSPWSIVSHLPGFSSARCTGRAFQFVILAGAILGGFGFDLWRRRFGALSKKRWLRLLPYAAAVIVVATNLGFAWPIMSSAFKTEAQNVQRFEMFSHVVDEKPQAYKNYLTNRGSLITPWLSAYHPSRGLVDAANTVHMEHVLSGKVESLKRQYTPNRISYELSASEAGRMVISMGYDRGWRAEDGRELRQQQGLLTFDFNQGTDRIVLVYRTPYILTGLVVSTAFLIGLIGVVATVSRRRIQAPSVSG